MDATVAVSFFFFLSSAATARVSFSQNEFVRSRARLVFQPTGLRPLQINQSDSIATIRLWDANDIDVQWTGTQSFEKKKKNETRIEGPGKMKMSFKNVSAGRPAWEFIHVCNVVDVLEFSSSHICLLHSACSQPISAMLCGTSNHAWNYYRKFRLPTNVIRLFIHSISFRWAGSASVQISIRPNQSVRVGESEWQREMF